MSERWLSVAEAAAMLKVHPRTVERRIAAGKIETQRGDDGQVLVLVDVSDSASNNSDAMETVKELADRQVDIAAGSASALVRFAQESTERAHQEMVLAKQEAAVARRGARWAWISVGLAAGLVPVLMMMTVTGSSRAINDARTDAKLIAQKLLAADEANRQFVMERDEARAKAEAALMDKARAQGELAAYVKQHPTTRPSNLMERLASAFGE